MNKAAKLIYSAVFFGICALPLALYPKKMNTREVEKHALAEKPKLVQKGKINNSFSSDFDSWFSDHLPYRPQLLTAADAVRSKVFGSSAAGVVTGKDGFIFSDTTLPSYLGTSTINDRELNAIAITLSLMQENTLAKGSGFTFVCAPNKNTVYPEKMPANYRKAEQTDLERLMPVLDSFGVNHTDLIGTLTSAKQSGLDVYHKRDTHWNYLGAYYGYDAIMSSLGREHKTYEDQSDYTLTRDWRGDIDKNLYPTGGGELDWQYHFNRTYDDFAFTRPPGLTDTQAALENFMSDKEDNDENFSSHKSGEPTGHSLYMVRDSFGRALLPYMIDNYDNATFVRTNLPNLMMVPMNGDFVYEIVERNLERVISTAPNMKAPLRDTDLSGAAASSGGNTLFIEDLAYGTRVYGLLSEDMLSDDSRIYIRLTGESGEYLFEAFPIAESAELEKQGIKDIPADKGFSMFLDTSLLSEGVYDVEVLTSSPEKTMATGVLAEYTHTMEKQEENENENNND